MTFQSSFGISLEKIALLTTLNFGIQLLVDAASAGFVDRIGYRASIVIAHAMAAVGIAMLALAGDVGCGAGPTFVGTLAGVFGEDLRPAFICAVIFPILMILALVLYKNRRFPNKRSVRCGCFLFRKHPHFLFPFVFISARIYCS